MGQPSRESRRRFRAAWELAATRVGMALIPPLPRPAVLRWADRLARLAWRGDRSLRETGRANLRVAFGGELDPAARDARLFASYRSFARVLLDVFWFARDPVRRLTEWVRFDPGIAAVTCERAQVLLTAHLGNWEVMGQAFALRGYPLMSVAAPLTNPAVDRLFVRMRTRSGQQVIPREGAVRRLVGQLRGGGKVAMLLDQNTKPADGGVFVDFFGLPVPVSQAAAMLALRTRSDVHFGCSVPRADGGYDVTVTAGIPAGELPRRASRAEVAALTRRMTGLTEQAVRRYPEHWLWTYKRWKHVPDGQRLERYPFYAKPCPAPAARPGRGGPPGGTGAAAVCGGDERARRG